MFWSLSLQMSPPVPSTETHLLSSLEGRYFQGQGTLRAECTLSSGPCYLPNLGEDRTVSNAILLPVLKKKVPSPSHWGPGLFPLCHSKWEKWNKKKICPVLQGHYCTWLVPRSSCEEWNYLIQNGYERSSIRGQRRIYTVLGSSTI